MEYTFTGYDNLTIINSMPDDCDDCGARGEQECKSTCPNAQHI